MPTLEAPSATLPVVEQSRLIRASAARVYAAWTNPSILKQWFGPENMFCPTASVDLRVGGEYRIDVHPSPSAPDPNATESAGRASSAHGVYTRLEPNRLLQFTWIPSWNPGEESLVTVTLHEAEGGTEVNIRHEQIDPAGCQGYERGWSGSLLKLAAALEA